MKGFETIPLVEMSSLNAYQVLDFLSNVSINAGYGYMRCNVSYDHKLKYISEEFARNFDTQSYDQAALHTLLKRVLDHRIAYRKYVTISSVCLTMFFGCFLASASALSMKELGPYPLLGFIPSFGVLSVAVTAAKYAADYRDELSNDAEEIIKFLNPNSQYKSIS